MLSQDLKRLRATYDDWIYGRVKPTEADMAAFSRDLGLCLAQASMIDLGIDPKRFDVVIASEEPETNVVLFPRGRMAPRRPPMPHGFDGDGF